jgi:hypothetical protein
MVQFGKLSKGPQTKSWQHAGEFWSTKNRNWPRRQELHEVLFCHNHSSPSSKLSGEEPRGNTDLHNNCRLNRAHCHCHCSHNSMVAAEQTRRPAHGKDCEPEFDWLYPWAQFTKCMEHGSKTSEFFAS